MLKRIRQLLKPKKTETQKLLDESFLLTLQLKTNLKHVLTSEHLNYGIQTYLTDRVWFLEELEKQIPKINKSIKEQKEKQPKFS